MGQYEMEEFIKLQPDKWFSLTELAEGLNIDRTIAGTYSRKLKNTFRVTMRSCKNNNKDPNCGSLFIEYKWVDHSKWQGCNR